VAQAIFMPRVTVLDVAMLQWFFIAFCAAPHHVRGIRLAPQEPSWQADSWQEDLIVHSGIAGKTATSTGIPQLASRTASPTGFYVLVYPPKKLAFCYIPKNACEQFNRLLNKLNNRTGDHGYPFGVSSLGSFGLTMADVSRENGWKWAVFLRNPLLRYLSAWASKCFHQEDDAAYCAHGMPSQTGSVGDFERHVLASHSHPGALAGESHWAEQQSACGGLRDASGYDFVGHLQGDVNRQVHDMFHMVGAPESNVDEYFPKDRIAGHHYSLSPYQYYKNATIQKFVHELYARDYDLPGI